MAAVNACVETAESAKATSGLFVRLKKDPQMMATRVFV